MTANDTGTGDGGTDDRRDAHDPSVADDLHDRPVDLCRHLVGFDTTNPPGDERACVEWIADVLAAYGVESETYARDPERPNLVARVEGGDADPLMLYGHVDVVPTTDQDWTHPPFDAVLDDGYVWGRGTLDMKGGVAMFLAGFLRAAAGQIDPSGDLVLLILSDEEAGGEYGAEYVVENHPEVFDGVDYALGEFGGFSMHTAGERLYPIQVAEKGICWLEITFQADAGHGAFPRTDTALTRMAHALADLDGTRLPVEITPAATEMIEGMADALPEPRASLLRTMLQPGLTDAVLDELGPDALLFDAAVHDVVNATIVRGGDKENVVPERVTLTVDCRLVPGHTPEDAIAQLRPYVGEEAEIEVLRYDAPPEDPDMGQYDLLADVLEGRDPEGTAVPFLLPAATDARHLTKAGVQTYGFTPMRLPERFDFLSLVHAADERVPVEAVEFGADAVTDVLRRY